MLIGYSRPDKRFTAAAQKALLLKAGVVASKIWEEVERGGFDEYAEMSHLVAPDRGLRAGDVLVVAWFHRLAANRRDLQMHIRGITKKKASILEASSGRSSTDPADFSEMVFEASNFYAGRSLTTKTATEMGQTGAKASPMSKKKKGMMPKADAIKIWRNPAYSKAEDALEAMNADPAYKGEWAKSRAYRELGTRDVPPGPRPTHGAPRYKVKPPRAKPQRKGHVYFMRIDRKDDVKIGFSTSVADRRRQMDTGHHGKIDVIATIEGPQSLERDLHRRFANYRKKGEWFSYTGPVKKFIEGIPDDKLK